MMTIVINKALSDATFGDLYTDTGNADWYRLWTGNATGSSGNFVDTSAFNSMGDGWIAKKHLAILKPDFAQADDTDLWVQTWSADKGFSEWVNGSVEFTVINQVCITTLVTGDTPLNQMFFDANVGLGTWYRVWISDPHDPDSGSFLDTPEGKGWIKPLEEGGNLSSLLFPAADPGESRDLWIRTWTKDQQRPNWEYWTVTTLDKTADSEDKDPEADVPVIPPAMNDDSETDEIPGQWVAAPKDAAREDLPQLPGKWIDTGPRILAEIGSAEIITGETIDSLDFTPIFQNNLGFTGTLKTDTRLAAGRDLGLVDGIAWYTGDYDPETGIFVSGDAAASQDLLVVYDTDAGGDETFYDMIVLTGVPDISDTDGDGVFTLDFG
jgi:hypothetical protein